MVSSATSTIDALRHVHAELGRELRALDAALSRPSEAIIADVRARLGALRERVAKHFRLEEQNGYMDVVRKRQPRLERAVLHLAAEHAELLRTLDTVIRESVGATELDARLRDKIAVWVERFHSHEDRENRLIEDAFDLDIGPGD
jgi:hypothetical protein